MGITRAHRLSLFLAAIVGAASAVANADDAQAPGKEIRQELKKFGEMGSVLYVAAHPDDENTQLITYLARGHGYRTAYLSLTRGDGGQNVLGPEFGEQLGLIRTHELLAARQVDGGRQFFTRALDFGFSKDPDETLRIWDKDEVLADVVRVIRTFRPDVVVTRFSPEPSGTHGHHTASAILALEAFKLAGDPKACPDQLKDGLTPWQPKRILQNGRGGGGLSIDAGGNDPVTGESFSKMAGRSRAMHKSQGFGNFGGGGGAGGPRPESFSLLAGDPATKDLMDGVDTTWSRVKGGDAIARLLDPLIERFDPAAPDKSIPALLDLRAAVAKLPGDTLIDEKRADLDRLLAKCLGLTVATELPRAEWVPGEPLKMHHTVGMTASVVPVKWTAIRYPDGGPEKAVSVVLSPVKFFAVDATRALPADCPVTQPYWLRKPTTAGMFVVDDPKLIGRPTNPPAFPVEFVFDVAGQELVVKDEPLRDGRKLEVIAPVSLHAEPPVRLFHPNTPESVTVAVTASRPNTKGVVRLEVPEGWKVTPAERDFSAPAVGDVLKETFRVTPPGKPASADLAVKAVVDGATYSTDRLEITYSHIPHLLLQPPATARAVMLDVVTRGRRAGYLPGAGDAIPDALVELKYDVKALTGDDLTPAGLQGLDCVVTGVRAFDVRKDLTPERMASLFAYVEQGGTLVVQYNRSRGGAKLAPYDLSLSQQRVTDENSKVTFLAPDHPALNTPNKIIPADFDNWVQERGTYFPDHWDAHFTPILSMHDEGEDPLQGSLLVAPYGKGYYVYTGLTFFRQLPAGNPGAYRLFANLLSLGKQ